VKRENDKLFLEIHESNPLPLAEHWTFCPPGRLCGLSCLSSSSNPRRSFGLSRPNQCGLLFVQYLPYKQYKPVLLQQRFFTARKERERFAERRPDSLLASINLIQ